MARETGILVVIFGELVVNPKAVRALTEIERLDLVLAHASIFGCVASEPDVSYPSFPTRPNVTHEPGNGYATDVSRQVNSHKRKAPSAKIKNFFNLFSHPITAHSAGF